MFNTKFLIVLCMSKCKDVMSEDQCFFFSGEFSYCHNKINQSGMKCAKG